MGTWVPRREHIAQPGACISRGTDRKLKQLVCLRLGGFWTSKRWSSVPQQIYSRCLRHTGQRSHLESRCALTGAIIFWPLCYAGPDVL